MAKRNLPLSVILLTHNQAEILALQIASLERQVEIKTSDFEVIITDDSSRESEIEKIEKILTKTPLRWRLLRQRVDRFWATKARNSAIGVAQGKLLLFFDGDMVPETNVLARHISMQEGKRKHILAGHRLRKRVTLQDGDNILNFDQFLDKCRRSGLSDRAAATWQKNEERKRKNFLRSKHPWRVVFSCHMSVQATPEVAFDERFIGWGPDDWELAYRLTKFHGYAVDFARDIIAYEVDHLGKGVGNVFRISTQETIIDYLRNTLYFFDTYPNLNIEDICWGLRKLKLRIGSWTITPANEKCNLRRRVDEIRSWLMENNYYVPPIPH